jgi:hypothetical protein
MNAGLIAAELTGMAAQEGICACALVEVGSGLVWCATADPGGSFLWEAAIDYWRLHQRQQLHFEALGDLHAAVMYHRHQMLAVLPCTHEPELVVVCVARHASVDWIRWQAQVRSLASRIESSLAH